MKDPSILHLQTLKLWDWGTVTGSFAKLKATVSDGKITNVQVVEEGSGYDSKQNTNKNYSCWKGCFNFSKDLQMGNKLYRKI